MTKNFYRIMSGIVCFLLVALALRGWVMNKKNTSPVSAGVVEKSRNNTAESQEVTFRVNPVLSKNK